MNGLKRCPQCHHLPEVTFEDKGYDTTNFIFECKEHGHMAMGQTIEMAVANWNLYVKLTEIRMAA